MATAAVNHAAWITAPKAPVLEVKEAPYPSAGDKDLIVKIHAVAINPLEYRIQDTNPAIGGKNIQYPTILGADSAGTIVAIGDGVKQRKVNERVVANVSSLGAASGAFQQFIVVPEHYAVPVPDGMSLESAVVLPLACDTASAGLFMQLGLSTAQLSQTEQHMATKEVVLVWGGSSSVGCCAIQLARAAGYRVFATASKRNHGLCSALGALRVFDYGEAAVESDIVSAMSGEDVIGALDCISDADKTIPACVRIVAKTSGQKKVVTVLTPPQQVIDDSVEVQRLSIPSMVGTETYEIVHAFMAVALQHGRLQPKPDPSVIGEGLEAIQSGIDAVRRGVSAQKIVVRI